MLPFPLYESENNLETFAILVEAVHARIGCAEIRRNTLVKAFRITKCIMKFLMLHKPKVRYSRKCFHVYNACIIINNVDYRNILKLYLETFNVSKDILKLNRRLVVTYTVMSSHR